jgi:hypothetical protein
VVECRRPLDGDAPDPLTAAADTTALVLPLADHHLPDGDYQVTLLEGASETPSMQASMRLRSADTPAETLDAPASLGYRLGASGVLGSISASELHDDEVLVRGACTVGSAPTQDPPSLVLPDAPAWLAARSTQPTVTAAPKVVEVVLGQEDAASCAVTGAHYMELPADTGQRPTSRMISGCCRGCGVVKWYPAWPRRQARTRRRGRDSWMHRPLDTTAVAPVAASQSVDWDPALDALCHLRGGTAGEFERIALQLDGSRVLVDSFVRGLEVLGHLDLARDPQSVRPTRWGIAPAAMAELPSGEYVLTGWRSQRLLDQLEASVSAHGGSLCRQPHADGPTVALVRGLERAALDAAVQPAAELLQSELVVVSAAAASMAAVLAPLSALIETLPRVALPHAQMIQRWDTATARWEPAALADRPGAYKLAGTRTMYGIRTHHDLGQGTVGVGTAQVVKHLAALQAGTPHVAYHARTSSLLVPLGADLPGLYGRAAVLCSGRLPSRLQSSPMLCYRDVPVEVAGVIVHALTR